MHCTIFYSWQSDLPNSTNRGFIQKALEAAAASLRDDESISIEPVVDRDTAGEPGAPDIAATIFGKIELAAVFVCDVSIIDPAAGRPAPNPNVLIELGYAMKVLGQRRIVLVMNTAYGGPDKLPFDLRQKRVTTYEAPKAGAKGAEHARLAAAFSATIKLSLADFGVAGTATPAASPGEQAINSIRGQRPDQEAVTRKFMRQLTDQIANLEWKDLPGEPDDNLVKAIEQSTPIVAEFNRVSESIAEMGAWQTATVLYKGFEEVLAGRYLSSKQSGLSRNTDADLWKFLGHEVMVCFVALLLREERWEQIGQVLWTPLLRSSEGSGKSALVTFRRLSAYVSLLEDTRRAKPNDGRTIRVSVHADLLKARHAVGPLGDLVPVSLFEDADYLLFLQSVVDGGDDIWRPWSAPNMEGRVPMFVPSAVARDRAALLATALGAPNVNTLRERLAEGAPSLEKLYRSRSMFYEAPSFEWATIGSR